MVHKTNVFVIKLEGMSQLKVYKASAGSGKTYRLVAEYIKILIHNPDAYRQILAVTFTNKATAEMKSRIVAELYNLGYNRSSRMLATLIAETQSDERKIRQQAKRALFNILHDYSMFSISTIDSFVQRVIQSLLWELGEQGNNDLVIDERPTLEKAVDVFLDEVAQNENLYNHLKHLMFERLSDNKSGDIRYDILKLGNMLFREQFMLLSSTEKERMFDGGLLRELSNGVSRICNDFEKNVSEKAKNIINIITQNGYDKNSFKSTGGFYSVIQNLTTSTNIKDTIDNDKLERDAFDKSVWLPQKQIKSNPQLLLLIENELAPQLSDLFAYIAKNKTEYATAIAIQENLPVLFVLQDLQKRFRQILRDEGAMLLSDSGSLLREFVAQSDTPFIYERMGTRYTSYMLDEFQDTSQVQWYNFKPLIADSLASGGLNLLVGDVKQSIYRFRNSDWQIMANIDTSGEFETFTESLSDNWRSAPTIVSFNHYFFDKAVENLTLKLNEIVNSSNIDNYVKLIKGIYSDIRQNAKSVDAEGYVAAIGIPINDDKRDFYSDTIRDILIDLKSRGYRPGDIAFLVRKNEQGKELAELLLSIKATTPELSSYINIVSQDALTLGASAAVRLCISALSLVLNPANSLAQAMLKKEWVVLNNTDKLWADVFLTEDSEELSWLISLRYYPLTQMLEMVIEHYGLNRHKQQLPYLSMLQEYALNFSYRGAALLPRFLDWYAQEGQNKKLVMAQAGDAINIMTIHKSKGLEFPVVIIPDADLTSKRKQNDRRVWAEIDNSCSNAIFTGLPIYPINLKKRLAFSYFSNSFQREAIFEMIDELNLQYVAYTRPKRELYLLQPYKKKDSDKKEENGTFMASDFYNTLPLDKDIFHSEHVVNDFVYVEFGKKEVVAGKLNKPNVEEASTRMLSQYPIMPMKGRIARQFHWNDETTSASGSGLAEGLAMHALLSKIITTNDIEPAVNWAVQTGLVNIEEKHTRIEQLKELLCQSPYSDWFSQNWKVKTEQSLINVGGRVYRPDRVLTRDYQAIIIDFKFGMPMGKHHKQVAQYIKLMNDMGYTNVKGFLCYITLNQIEEVLV